MKITCKGVSLILSVGMVTIYTFPRNVEKSDRQQTHKKQNVYVGKCTPLGVPDFTTEYNITKFYDIGARWFYENIKISVFTPCTPTRNVLCPLPPEETSPEELF